jgi:hypothetical protein
MPVPLQVAKTFGVRGAIPLVGMRHHDNHAYFSFGIINCMYAVPEGTLV